LPPGTAAKKTEENPLAKDLEKVADSSAQSFETIEIEKSTPEMPKDLSGQVNFYYEATDAYDRQDFKTAQGHFEMLKSALSQQLQVRALYFLAKISMNFNKKDISTSYLREIVNNFGFSIYAVRSLILLNQIEKNSGVYAEYAQVFSDLNSSFEE
jgi:hypothetical protein